MTGTITLHEAAARRWDALVVGAGPAGSLAARLIARAGRSVLLVEKKTFPRDKVCGCCLNGWGLASLDAAGLGAVADRLGAVELTLLRLAAGGVRATVPLARAVAVSRAALDEALAGAAIEAGAEFLPATAARPIRPEPDGWHVELKNGQTEEVEASIVIAADGLAGRTADPAGPVMIRRASRMGLGAIAPASQPGYEPGAIHMACASGGYAGLVRIEDGRLNIGAAVDPEMIKELTPAGALAQILRACRMPPIEAPESLDWRGTPFLSRRRAGVATHRMFALGDSAGYVEPFTGEGMGWALVAATALAPIASRDWAPQLADEWELTFRKVVRSHWRRCAALAWLVRRPNLSRAAVGTLGALPTLVAPLIRAIQQPGASR
ncbi:MAG: FAD-dependent monooxygenase [Candidatus Sumerlaeia bacterium]